MKIAVDVTPILPGGECGGAKQLVLELLKGLGKNAVSDQFILLTADYNDAIFEQFDSLGMKRICVLKKPRINHISFGWRVFNRLKSMVVPYTRKSILKQNNVSVLFCPMTAPAFHDISVPTVSIVYDLQHLYYPSFFSATELAHRNSFYDNLKSKVNHIVCISSFTKKTVIEKLCIAPENVVAIPICIQSRLTVPSSDFTELVLRKFNLYGKTYCIYPANLWPHKNHKMLLTAFNMFSEKYFDYNLNLVLTGTDVASNKVFGDAIEQMGLEEKVHFLGYVPEDILSVIWHNSHFLIFPSLFEGFGIPLVEAMMYGKPILAGNVASIPEVAGDAAVYFDPRKPDEIVSSLCTIMEDRDLYSSLVARGKERLKLYDFSKMVDRYISALHEAGKRGIFAGQTEVSGIYSDGWAGDCIHVAFTAARYRRTFRIEGFIPNKHPRNAMALKVKCFNGKTKKYVLKKNEILTLKETVPETEGILEIHISGGFIPGNGDPRKLTFRINNSSIIEDETGAKLYEFSC